MVPRIGRRTLRAAKRKAGAGWSEKPLLPSALCVSASVPLHMGLALASPRPSSARNSATKATLPLPVSRPLFVHLWGSLVLFSVPGSLFLETSVTLLIALPCYGRFSSSVGCPLCGVVTREAVSALSYIRVWPFILMLLFSRLPVAVSPSFSSSSVFWQRLNSGRGVGCSGSATRCSTAGLVLKLLNRRQA